MSASLLVIDPQNDFMDQPGAALPVKGAMDDMRKLSNLMRACGQSFESIALTLDSHAAFGIERPGFWCWADGRPVPPFTVVTLAQVESGEIRTIVADHLTRAWTVLNRLQNNGKYQLMVWPRHCVIGTWGHAVQAQLIDQIGDWEVARGRRAAKFLKGTNPYTEHYSAVRAEVVLEGEADTDTNEEIMAWLQAALAGGGRIYVAGEASSHCVRATVMDACQGLGPEAASRFTLLTDCMSPVPSFEAQHEAFFNWARQQRMQLRTAEEAAREISA